jgi:hypothetical protein
MFDLPPVGSVMGNSDTEPKPLDPTYNMRKDWTGSDGSQSGKAGMGDTQFARLQGGGRVKRMHKTGLLWSVPPPIHSSRSENDQMAG